MLILMSCSFPGNGIMLCPAIRCLRTKSILLMKLINWAALITTLGIVEQLEVSSGMFLTSADINRIIEQMSAYALNEGIALNNINDVRQNDELMAVLASGWKAA